MHEKDGNNSERYKNKENKIDYTTLDQDEEDKIFKESIEIKFAQQSRELSEIKEFLQIFLNGKHKDSKDNSSNELSKSDKSHSSDIHRSIEIRNNG